MKLTVLGGSAAGPNTGAGCSGYLVETAAARLALDLGPGTLPELRRHADYRALDAIVISHAHLDHVLDLASLRYALAYNPRPAATRLPLWLPPGGHAVLDRIAAAFADPGEAPEFFSAVFDVATFDPGGSLSVGDALIRFAPTVHYVQSWAMRVSTRSPGSDLGYTADTGPAANLAPFFAGVGALVAEATLVDPGNESFGERGHLTAAEAGTLARDAGAGILILSHLWEELGFATYRAQAAARFRGRLEIARPGLTVEW